MNPTLQNFTNETNKENISQLPSETLLKQRDEFISIIESAEKLKKEIEDELYRRADAQPSKSFEEGDRKVQIVTRTSYKNVPLEFAKRYKAVKLVIDTVVMGAFIKQGIQVPNLIFTQYLLVK